MNRGLSLLCLLASQSLFGQANPTPSQSTTLPTPDRVLYFRFLDDLTKLDTLATQQTAAIGAGCCVRSKVGAPTALRQGREAKDGNHGCHTEIDANFFIYVSSKCNG